jgi:molecular chaperone GrpE
MDNKMTDTQTQAAEPMEGSPAEIGELPAPVPLTPREIEQLKEKASKADEYWQRLLRETADFENYKKRAVRERQEAVTYANESLLQKLVPALDAFEMALAATTKDPDGAQSLRAGIVMISNQLKTVLHQAGLEEFDATGKVFDPNFHEALSQEQTDEAAEGSVVRQIRKGYKFRNRLIRPAGVVVAKKPAA